jgi:broad specificity phosphatase PhoE
VNRLLLLRHVHAGDRSTYRGDDRHRPASDRGRRQADALVAAYAAFQVATIVTSPLTRCVQSVEPLAAALGVAAEEADELAEGSPPDVVQRFLRQQQRRAADLGGDLVACSHGDVIGDLVLALHVRGVPLPGRPAWPKASTWVLEGPLGAALEGTPESLRVDLLPPPT